MRNELRGFPPVITGLIVVGTLAGLFAAYKRLHVEASNRRVEIALEWPEVSNLAQTNPQHQTLQAILAQFKAQGVSALVIPEDTLTTLEQSGAVHPERTTSGGWSGTRVQVDSVATFQRIQAALQARGWSRGASTSGQAEAVAPGGTRFVLPSEEPTSNTGAFFAVPIEYTNLRTMGLGLPADAVQAAKDAGLRIAGRIGNFPGISLSSAEAVLQSLHDQGATTVIFSGEEVLGFRGLEKSVAELLREQGTGNREQNHPFTPSPLHPFMAYGAVEFGKQKGDEKIAMALRGDYVRVHSIQAAEMGQIDESEAMDRFARAARERNIRFCYVRLLTFAGNDPVAENVAFLSKIARSMTRGSELTGGRIAFGAARTFPETGVPSGVFVVVGLGVAAGTVWMLRVLCPMSGRFEFLLLVGLSFVCAGLAVGAGEMGRKLVALLAGVAFPAVACLRTLPNSAERYSVHSKKVSIAGAVRGITLASAITAIGIVHVIGLLATRSFMLKADQFLGIKAQHVVPLLIIAFAALAGGLAIQSETWERYRARAKERLRAVWNEPARFGLLVLGLVALIGLSLVVARTGNDAGVGVSGIELKFRATLDRVLPVRPRTKEFLVGHPAFVLGLAWWLRGRRRWAVPAFVVGSLGQVSLLNTFCHIHTPLMVSVWRDGIGLVCGTLLGILLFLFIEMFLPPPIEDVPNP